MTKMLFVDIRTKYFRLVPGPVRHGCVTIPLTQRMPAGRRAAGRWPVVAAPVRSAGGRAAGTTSWSSVAGTTGWSPPPTWPGRGGRSWCWSGWRQVGGAAVSRQVFEGVDVRLSAYSYLVSLLPDRIVTDLGLEVRLADRTVASYTAIVARRPPRRAAGRARRRARPRRRSFRAAHRLRRRVRRLAALLRPAGHAGRGPRPHPDRAAALRGRAGRAGCAIPQLWHDLRERPLADVVGRPPRRRRRPRGRPDRRPDRHVRRRARRRRPRRPLLPLPPGRQRHGPLAGAGRRHGRGQRRHGGRGARRPARSWSPGRRSPRSTRARTASPCTGPTTTAPSGRVDAGHVVSGAAPDRAGRADRRRPRAAAVGLAAEGQHGAGPAAPAALRRRPGHRVRRHLPRGRGREPRSTPPTRRPRPARCPTSSRSRSTATR